MRLFRRADISWPAQLNTLSEGTEEEGTVKQYLANHTVRGHFSSFDLHQVSGLDARGAAGSSLYALSSALTL